VLQCHIDETLPFLSWWGLGHYPKWVRANTSFARDWCGWEMINHVQILMSLAALYCKGCSSEAIRRPASKWFLHWFLLG